MESVQERRIWFMPRSCQHIRLCPLATSLPVCAADISSVVRRHTATIDNDGENHETCTGGHFEHAESEFDLDDLATVDENPSEH